jgi:hypothetical protein
MCSFVTILFLALVSTMTHAAEPQSVVWKLQSTTAVGGHAAKAVGAPKVIDTAQGKVVEFDGKQDALRIEINPLEGMAAFTIEAIFRPDADGLKEQRFLHIQQADNDNRVMLETRLTANGLWYADTYIRAGKAEKPLNSPKLTHKLGVWHNLTLVYDGQQMIQYVDGVKELSAKIAAPPMGAGRTSVGSRGNDVHWFKGAIREIRITPRALKPEEMLKAEQ